MTYYDLHPFSEAQALHAAERVLYLIRNRRFFLHIADKNVYREEDYRLHPKVFAEAIKLNRAHVDAHRDAREQAREAIQQFEADNRIVAPTVPQGKSIVDYSRYSGGFEICRVYPLTAFAKYVPKSLETLVDKLFQQRMSDQTEDDLAPKVVRGYRESAENLATIIWEQLQAIDAANPDNNRCLVLLQSRIDMGDSDINRDFAQGRVWDMQDFPFAVGFLFYEFSKEERIIQHDYAVFSTSRKAHVHVKHWSDAEPSINYFKDSGYSCKVMFATVL